MANFTLEQKQKNAEFCVKFLPFMQCFTRNSLKSLGVPVPATKAVSAKQGMHPQHADTSRTSGV